MSSSCARAIVFGFISLALFACERERIVEPGLDATPPLPPAGIQIDAARDGYILISWLKNTELDLHGYIVYRSEVDASDFIPIDTVTQQYFFDEQRSYDTLYFYYVSAIDRSANESLPSDTVSAISPNRFAPEPVRELTVNGEHSATRRLMRLSWVEVEESDLAGYRVYRSTSPFAAPESSLLLTETEASIFDDSSATSMFSRYYYAVTAVDRGGLESELSGIQSDIISSRPQQISPLDDERTSPFPLFVWSRLGEAIAYRLTLSVSEYTGEFWSVVVHTTDMDSVRHRFSSIGLAPGRMYYWRVSSITQTNGRPNGISDSRRFFVGD